MEIGSSNSAPVAQPAPQQQTRQAEPQQRQAELETSSQRSAENAPTPDSRVGSVINTQA